MMADNEGLMGTTKQIPRSEWKSYFERFSKQHLNDQVPEAVTIEVLSPAIGDQFEARAAPLLGFTYDPKSNAFQVLLEDADHLVYDPKAIWVIETEDGGLSTLEIVGQDGTQEIIYVYRTGLPARRYEFPFMPRP